MHSLLLVLALSAEPAAVTSPSPSLASCTADRLRRFVGPTGIHQPWPAAADLPSQFASASGVLLSDQGMVADGYTQTLHVDPEARTAYVVQQGGFAGFRTVYGPLPVAGCPGSAP
jgi:hypothetical protein